CWESSGGISIGFAFGIAYFLVNRPMSATEAAIVARRRSLEGPNFEWLIVFLGLASYSSMFLAGQTAVRYGIAAAESKAVATEIPTSEQAPAESQSNRRGGQGANRFRTVVWSNYCLTILDLFALIYYLAYRPVSRIAPAAPDRLETHQSF